MADSQKSHRVLSLDETLSSLPPVPDTDFRSQVRQKLISSKAPILVILDDDPTGTQTCHDINIITAWHREQLVAEFERTEPGSGFFILTNSRSMHPEEAQHVIKEICTNLQTVAQQIGVSFEVLLRGDSTLRGHFPIEEEAVMSVLGGVDAWIICPFFSQGGRFTIDDTHYVREGSDLVPAAQTPFAKDATFGYKSSNLRDYVVEKSQIRRENTTSISLSTIRTGGIESVWKQLLEATDRTQRPVIIINAASETDVDIVIAALIKASDSGKRFLYRTGAAFVSARLGISPIPPITANDLQLQSQKDKGGLVIAGSYVPKTTAQLEVLRRRSGKHLTSIVLNVNELLKSPENSTEIQNAIRTAEEEIKQGQDVLVMTSRELITGDNKTQSLNIGSAIARALVSFLRRLEEKPRYIIAKGGITSSDMATKGLKMKRALIIGQAAPGVPLWRCDEPESKWPGLPYVVFPGNVGTEETLYDVVEGWRV